MASKSKSKSRPNSPGDMFEADGGVRVAIEGCGHGTLDAIYASVETASKARGWDGVDLLIIGGDFQAVRNAADLTVMSVPAKYRQLGDFPSYYSGKKKAPYLTIFIAGNHEASSHLWELYYGGWVAPNIYYLGAANVVRFGPLRIAAMSGIWKWFDYGRPHHERLPFSYDDIRSFYHVREIDVRKLLLLREQVDVGMSHDWPRYIENHGNSNALFKMKPDFKQESIDGVLGNPAAEQVLARLRPAYWFSAHLHCKFTAIRRFLPPDNVLIQPETSVNETPALTSEPEQATGNPDEIDLDDGEDEAPAVDILDSETTPALASEAEQVTANPDEIDIDDEDDQAPAGDMQDSDPAPSIQEPTASGVSDELRAQLPASFAAPAPVQHGPKLKPGQPVPPTIKNLTTRFLALDKCLPGRKFIQLCTLAPVDWSKPFAYRPSPPGEENKTKGKRKRRQFALQYDPEWLAITRVFAPHLKIGDPAAQGAPDLGEEEYTRLIDAERAWVDEHIVRPGKLAVPENFAITAPPHVPGSPGSVSHQPDEYTNPQTSAFCELVGVPDLWDASPEERAERKARGPQGEGPKPREGGGGGGGSSRGGRGRGGFKGGRGRGRGRGRGGR
ncbi:lariat debranching enzyme, C-terminal domain-containing protein [Xylaria cf. heliscus]|nr:lariat debranching enzyme, C-terminal domain-containing protein [Xylaria cf. heliscus]